MYFYKEKGKQILDMRGDLVLTHNDSMVKGRVKSAAPSAVRNAKRIENIAEMGVWHKLKTTLRAVQFIWGKSQALTKKTIDGEFQA